MTKIIYFITPTSLVKIGIKAAEFIPVVGPTLEYSKKAKKLTAITDPVSASSRGIGLIFNYCFGKTATLSIECGLWFGFTILGGLTGNPVLIAAGAQCGSMVVDEMLD